jgi:putative SOS response-associated peptidase YedK
MFPSLSRVVGSKARGFALALRASAYASDGLCGRYSNTAGPEEIGKTFGPALGVQIREPAGTGRYKIFPSEKVLTIVAGDEAPEPRMLRWGLIPSWAKDMKLSSLINATTETLLSKGKYYGVPAESSHRALIVADGFYEWMKAEDRKQKSQPYRFTVDEGSVFALAGLWTVNHRVGKDPLESCALLTCPPNPLVRPIHDRMPVLLADPESLRGWLSADLTAQEALTLCTPFPAERMSVRPVSRDVNKAGGIDGPELFEPPSA